MCYREHDRPVASHPHPGLTRSLALSRLEMWQAPKGLPSYLSYTPPSTETPSQEPSFVIHLKSKVPEAIQDKKRISIRNYSKTSIMGKIKKEEKKRGSAIYTSFKMLPCNWWCYFSKHLSRDSENSFTDADWLSSLSSCSVRCMSAGEHHKYFR